MKFSCFLVSIPRSVYGAVALIAACGPLAAQTATPPMLTRDPSSPFVNPIIAEQQANERSDMQWKAFWDRGPKIEDNLALQSMPKASPMPDFETLRRMQAAHAREPESLKVKSLAELTAESTNERKPMSMQDMPLDEADKARRKALGLAPLDKPGTLAAQKPPAVPGMNDQDKAKDKDKKKNPWELSTNSDLTKYSSGFGLKSGETVSSLNSSSQFKDDVMSTQASFAVKKKPTVSYKLPELDASGNFVTDPLPDFASSSDASPFGQTAPGVPANPLLRPGETSLNTVTDAQYLQRQQLSLRAPTAPTAKGIPGSTAFNSMETASKAKPVNILNDPTKLQPKPRASVFPSMDYSQSGIPAPGAPRKAPVAPTPFAPR